TLCPLTTIHSGGNGLRVRIGNIPRVQAATLKESGITPLFTLRMKMHAPIANGRGSDYPLRQSGSLHREADSKVSPTRGDQSSCLPVKTWQTLSREASP